MIRFDHVFKQYGKHTFALSDITVSIGDGEFVFLIGPSGAGKSTLLRLLIRDLLPTRGNVFIDDTEVNSVSGKQVHLLRRKVGMVFQDFKLLSDRTVYENVAIGLEILGKKETEINKGVMNILDLVDLADKANMFPLQLAAGEKQRTGIARAVVGGPKILLADEPTGNLDPDTSWGILSILQEINKVGTTVVMATHNAGIVNDLRKRTISISRGKIVSDEEKGRYHTTRKAKENPTDAESVTDSVVEHPKEKKIHGNT
jgi:cell division transport system ATP-binding protein